MSLPVSITIDTEEPFHTNIRNNGFITCVLTFHVPPFDSFRMAFCLHCKELFSYTGCLKHVKKLPSKQRIALPRLFCPDKIDRYKQQILADVEIFYENGQTSIRVILMTPSISMKRPVALKTRTPWKRAHKLNCVKMSRKHSYLDHLIKNTTLAKLFVSKTSISNRNGTVSRIAY